MEKPQQTPDQFLAINTLESVDPDDTLLENNNSLPLSLAEKEIIRDVLDELTQQTTNKIQGSSGDTYTEDIFYIYDPRRLHDPLSVPHEKNLTRAYRRLAEEIKQIKEDESEIVLQKDRDTIIKGSFPDENKHLQELVDLKREIGEKIFLHNTGLSLSFAKRSLQRGVDLEDLVQEANMGLLHAIDKFNPELGFRFSTYATLWIRQKLSRTVADGKPIRVPELVRKQIRSMHTGKQSFEEEHGKAPTKGELADALKITPEEVDELIAIENVFFVKSIHAPIQDTDGSTELINILPDKNSMDDEMREYIELADTVGNILSILDERETEILRRRYGLDFSVPHTLQEVADQMGMSKERIRQIEKGAVLKLRIAARKNRFSEDY